VKTLEGTTLKTGNSKIKNTANLSEATDKLEKKLKMKYNNFGYLIVHSHHTNKIFHDLYNVDNPLGF
jgi:hypothetical protein